MSSSYVQLSMRAEALKPRRFGMSKPNPIAIAHIISPSGDDEYIGRTEVSEKTTEPDWLKLFPLKYQLGSQLTVKVAIYDVLVKIEEEKIRVEDISSDKSRYRFIGCERFSLNKILEEPGHYMSNQMTGKRGTITLCAEKTKGTDQLLSFSFQFRAMSLASSRSFSTRMANSFFEISRKLESKNGEAWDKVYRSETIENHMNPVWKHTNIDVRALCNSDFKRPIRVQVFDSRRSGKQKPLGFFETNLEKILASKSMRGNADLSNAYTLVQDDIDVGKLVVIEAEIRQEIPYDSQKKLIDVEETPENGTLDHSTHGSSLRPSFQDYQFGGCKISISVAIDFSSKNGNENDKDFPHRMKNYRDGDGYNYTKMNEYQKAILDVGSILTELDSNKAKFSVFGLGIHENDTDLHLFQCGMKKEVNGISGVLDAYAEVRRGGFAPSDTASLVENINMGFRKAKHIEKRSKHRLCYSILLILTSGEIDNVKETKQALTKASSGPLSIIFVGIGNKKFRKLKEISKDHEQNTTFVDFALQENEEVLREEVLKHVPDHIVEYFWEKGILPHDM